MASSADLVSADQLLDKTLYAKVDVPIFLHIPDESSPQPLPDAIVKAGNPVGVVFSYIGPDPTINLTSLWWMFYGQVGNDTSYYYAQMVPGRYDFDSLQQQGVLTVQQQVQQQQAAQAAADKPWYSDLVDEVKPIIITGIIVFAAFSMLGKVLPQLFKGSQTKEDS